jgi:hypothetical protein
MDDLYLPLYILIGIVFFYAFSMLWMEWHK